MLKPGGESGLDLVVEEIITLQSKSGEEIDREVKDLLTGNCERLSTAAHRPSGTHRTLYVSESDRCTKCGRSDTPQWRYIHTTRFCNACYMRVKRYVETHLNRAQKLPSRARTDLSPIQHAQLTYQTFNIVSEAFKAMEQRGDGRSQLC